MMAPLNEKGAGDMLMGSAISPHTIHVKRFPIQLFCQTAKLDLRLRSNMYAPITVDCAIIVTGEFREYYNHSLQKKQTNEIFSHYSFMLHFYL